MGKEHLTELPWKQLLRRAGLKDSAGLDKVLAAYAKSSQETDYQKTLDLLEQMEAKAKELAKDKGFKGNKEAVEYLEKVSAEVDKETNSVTRLKKSADKVNEEEEGDEEEEEDEDTVNLEAALAAVKKGKSFAFVVAIAKPSALALAKKIGGKHRAAVAEMAGSKKFIFGTCLFEENSYTFVVEKLVENLAKNLKGAIYKQTEKKAKVRVRDNSGGLDVVEENDPLDVESESSKSGQPPQPESESERNRKAEAAELKAYNTVLATLKSESANVKWAKKMPPDEAVRLYEKARTAITRVPERFKRDFPASTREFPDVQGMFNEIEIGVREMTAKAEKEVTAHCVSWLTKNKALNVLPNVSEDYIRSLGPAGVKARAKELLAHINEVEEGVHRDRGMLERLGISKLEGALSKVESLMSIARGELNTLRPQRASESPPVNAKPMARPIPEGVDAPEAFEEVCKNIDNKIRAGETPNPDEIEVMLSTAEGALNAAVKSKGWNWKEDLKKTHKTWDGVKDHYKSLKKSKSPDAMPFISGYWWFRKTIVDRKMSALAKAYDFEWESVGSTNPESDYDISVKTHGRRPVAVEGGSEPRPKWDYEIVREFNKAIYDEYKVQPGTLFDTNLYASAPAPKKKPEEMTESEKEVGARAAAGEDIGALLKMRRYMDWEDYVELQEQTLIEMRRAIKDEKDKERQKALFAKLQAAEKQFDTSDAIYFTSIAKTLVNAGVDISDIDDTTADGQKEIIERMQHLEHDDPDKLMEANNDQYVSAMTEVRELEKLIKEKDEEIAGSEGDPERKQKLQVERADMLNDLTRIQAQAKYFAAEAYHSEGPMKHIVEAAQKSGSNEELKKKMFGEISVQEFLQSLNEQLGDFLKDLSHYEVKSPFPGLGFYRSSKYLERFLEALEWLAIRMEKSGLADAAQEIKNIRIAGKSATQLKGEIGDLVKLRGAKIEFPDVEDQDNESQAFSMDLVRKIFGSSVQTLKDLGKIVKEAGKQANVIVRKSAAT